MSPATGPAGRIPETTDQGVLGPDSRSIFQPKEREFHLKDPRARVFCSIYMAHRRRIISRFQLDPVTSSRCPEG